MFLVIMQFSDLPSGKVCDLSDCMGRLLDRHHHLWRIPSTLWNRSMMRSSGRMK